MQFSIFYLFDFMWALFRYFNAVAAASRGNILWDTLLSEYTHILELWCGDGEFAKAVRKNNEHIVHYWWCDVENLLLDNAVLDYYVVISDISSFEKLLQEKKIDLIIVAYVFHHIADDSVILSYLEIAKKYNKKVLVVEEIAVNSRYKKVLCLNDYWNIFEYRWKVNDWKKYFALNFKSRNEWSAIFEKAWWSCSVVKRWFRKVYMYIEVYLLKID